MRSKYLKTLVSLVLSIIFYAILLPVFILVRDFIGINNETVFNVIQFLVFLFVYGIVTVFVEFVLHRMNEKARVLQKARGGRDIAAEEMHEDETTGLISLSITDKK